MAKIKRITVPPGIYPIGSDVYVRLEIVNPGEANDGYLLDNSDGNFAAAPADSYITMTEDGSTTKFELDESRQIWADGKVLAMSYRKIGGSRDHEVDESLASRIMNVELDAEVSVDSSIRNGGQKLFSLIESQRGSHTGKGQLIYWDPIGGSDSNSGLVFSEPKKTYNFGGPSGAHSLMTENSHDIIIGLPNPGGGPTIVSEYFEIDKAYNFFRGPGRDWMFQATHNEACAVLLSAEGCELSGCRVETKQTGSQDAICASGDFAKIKSVWVDYSRGSGIKIDNASSCELDNFTVQDSAQGGSGHAVHLLGDTSLTTRNIISSGEIFENGNGGGGADGIRVDGEFCEHNFIHGGSHALLIHDNTGWGVQNVNGAIHTIIVGPTVHVGHNVLGQVNVDLTSVQENITQWGTAENLALIPTEALSVLAYPGEFGQPATQRGGKVYYPKETLSSFAYDLNTDIAGKTIKFMAKLDLSDSDADAAIALKNITSSVTDEANGLGLVPLTEAETDIEPTEYYAEVQSVNGSGAVEARWIFRLIIVDNVVDGA